MLHSFLSSDSSCHPGVTVTSDFAGFVYGVAISVQLRMWNMLKIVYERKRISHRLKQLLLRTIRAHNDVGCAADWLKRTQTLLCSAICLGAGYALKRQMTLLRDIIVYDSEDFSKIKWDNTTTLSLLSKCHSAK